MDVLGPLKVGDLTLTWYNIEKVQAQHAQALLIAVDVSQIIYIFCLLDKPHRVDLPRRCQALLGGSVSAAEAAKKLVGTNRLRGSCNLPFNVPHSLLPQKPCRPRVALASGTFLLTRERERQIQ